MNGEPDQRPAGRAAERVPPYSEEAERSVLGSILLDALRVLDLCVTAPLTPESFHVPAQRALYAAMLDMQAAGQPIDVLTLAERLKTAGRLEDLGGTAALHRLIDETPTAAHAEYYIDIVRQKHLLRTVLSCVRETERACYESLESADQILSRAEQSMLDITERQHGELTPWDAIIKQAMGHIEAVLHARRGLTGLSTGFANLDGRLQGLRPSEMIVVAARPSMGKTSLAMNIAENVALGRRDPDGHPHAVGIFSLEMSREALALRLLCSHARVPSFDLARGFVPGNAFGRLTQSASLLTKAPVYLDDTGGLDVTELRARARRMRKKYGVELIVIDYLQLLQGREAARQGRQLETAYISNHLKAMAKELRLPVLVLSQLSRAPEQRDKVGKPKLSDLRDSGAIEQDADVVCMLRRPCKYPDDDEAEDRLLAVVDVAKQRNGPTGEVRLNFEEEFTRFADRAEGVDGAEALGEPVDIPEAEG